MKTKMKVLSVIVLSLLIGSLSLQKSQSQEQKVRKSPEEMAKAQVEWMKTDLKLDDATQSKVYDVVLKYAKQASDERQKSMAASNHETMKAKMSEITEARDKELKVILGDKNFELFKSKEAERRQAMMQSKQK
jgi:hypothetical protein